MAGFEDLEVWQRAVELSAKVYLQLTECRDFGYKDQITRSGLSIPSNIAEGMERSTPADQCKFLDYARGSCGEFRTQTIVGQKARFLPQTVAESWITESKELSAMIQGLIRSIRRNH
ncbi:four helix bundle protein, partial [Planctomycetes bacterium CA13]|uniref:four helix bundle protein n=1 Tax=Novipirellula herctigrandis TaxID=2527986 RepID=UPI0011B42E60